LAVTLRLALSATVQVRPLTESHPDQLLKLFPAAVEGAVTPICVPSLKTSDSGEFPLAIPLLSAGLTVIGTPDAGFVEATVRECVTGSGET
jgi:hypothetical protein